jgi:opacity protein-like surface antigen
MNRVRFAVALLALAGASLAAPARAEWVVTPPRPGQVGLSLQGQYGLMLNTGTLGRNFDQGPGLAVRLRYRMRYERAMGLSFEGQRFDARDASADPTAVKNVNLFAYGVDIYQMFGTRTRNTKWVGVGAGIVQLRRTLNDKEIEFGSDNDGAYVSAGAGVERFVWQSWALDLSARYLSVFQGGRANHDLQASAGIIVYAAY